MKIPAIILDCDGTIMNIWHRRKDFDKKKFKEFMSKMHLDTPNEFCTRIIDKFKNDHSILLVTGRNEEYREVTEQWLNKYDIYYDRLLMRQDNDHTKDSEVKTLIYNEILKDTYEVLFVIDDRQQVVNAWRELGLVCLQCDVGDY